VKREEDYAVPVVAWLRDLRWEVYQEVDGPAGIADIVATQGPLVWAIEVKKQFGVAVVGQAARWRGYANLVSVATGVSGRQYSPDRCFLESVMRERGIGWLVVHVDGFEGPVREPVHPRLRRRTSKALKQALREEQKTFARAGSAHGGHFTPFKQTCARVLAYVSAHPGCSIKELLGGIETHYSRVSTARSCLARWILAGVVEGVRSEDGKLYAEQADAARGGQ